MPEAERRSGSGGETREAAGPRSEASSYWEVRRTESSCATARFGVAPNTNVRCESMAHVVDACCAGRRPRRSAGTAHRTFVNALFWSHMPAVRTPSSPSPPRDVRLV